MALIKSDKDIKNLRIAGRYLAEVLKSSEEYIREGMTLNEIDQFIDLEIRKRGCKPSFLHYEGYPNASCLSLNEKVVHGIPDETVVKDGDILGVDVGLWYENVCVDSAITVPIGNISNDAKKLIQVTKDSLIGGIKAAKPYRRIGSVSHAIQEFADEAHLGIVKVLTGHGVGHAVHEEPCIPNYGHTSDGIIMKPGMVLAIEPMFTLGSCSVETEVDGWGVVTSDDSLSAHFEHTVLITKNGCEILTKVK